MYVGEAEVLITIYPMSAGETQAHKQCVNK